VEKKSHSASAASFSPLVFAIFSFGKRARRISSTPRSTLFGQSVTSSSGRYFSNSASIPGVWAMSPMFTVCHEERSTI